MLTFIAIVISLSLIIFFHEGGHFVFSKIAGIKVEEFGFGYPPRMMGIVRIKSTKKWKIFFGKKLPPAEELDSTIYSLNWIPFGGFNKIKGEAGESDEPDNFYAKPWWQRFFSLAGGVIMNVILAMILFSIAFMAGMPTVAEDKDLGKNALVKERGVQIIQIQKKSPAEKAGIILGDIVLRVDNQEVKTTTDLQNYIDQKINQEINLVVKRRGQERALKIVPQKAEEVFSPEELKDRTLKGGVIGVSLAEVKIVAYPFFSAIWQGTKMAIKMFGRVVKGVYLILKELFVSHKMIGEAVGVVGIATFIGEAYQIGLVYLVQFLGLISIAIAVSQLIPFPALDGGRLLFLLIEIIRRKPVSRKTEALIHNIGFTLLLLLMLFITYRDLLRLGDKLFK